MSKPTVIQRYLWSNGRITRSEWMVRVMVVGIVCMAFGTLLDSWIGESGESLAALAFLWSASTISVQRLHDMGKGGASLLILLIPIVGPVSVLISLLRRGVDHENRYGSDPSSRSDYLNANIAE